MMLMMMIWDVKPAALPNRASPLCSGSGGNGKTRTAMHRADWVGKRGKFKKVKIRYVANYRTVLFITTLCVYLVIILRTR